MTMTKAALVSSAILLAAAFVAVRLATAPAAAAPDWGAAPAPETTRPATSPVVPKTPATGVVTAGWTTGSGASTQSGTVTQPTLSCTVTLNSSTNWAILVTNLTNASLANGSADFTVCNSAGGACNDMGRQNYGALGPHQTSPLGYSFLTPLPPQGATCSVSALGVAAHGHGPH